jgi:kinesin family protein C1
MLNHKIELTQSNINSAQSSLQSLQLENAQTNAAVIDLDFQRKKIEAEIKFTTERLQEELKTTREQLINQIKTTTEEFNLEFETKKTKIRRLKEQSNSKLKKNQELDQILSGHQSVNKALFEKVNEAEENRRKMCDSIQELKGNIRILCRLSPASVFSMT